MILKVVALGMLLLFVLALRFVRFTIEASEYPVLLAACQQATGAQREKMVRIVASAAQKTSVFNFTKAERDDFLEAGGYCLTATGDSSCKPLPKGVEAEGIAIDIFGHSRCDYPPVAPNICKPAEANKRC